MPAVVIVRSAERSSPAVWHETKESLLSAAPRHEQSFSYTPSEAGHSLWQTPYSVMSSTLWFGS